MARNRRHSPRAENQEVWQPFADLAMGLMAMLTLVLSLVLHQQVQAREHIERQLQDIKEREQSLIRTSGRFAAELHDVLQQTFDAVHHQNIAEDLIRNVFEGDCRLALAENGTLSMKHAQDGSEAAELYRGGAFAMSAQGRDALASCRENFARLAHCLSWQVAEDASLRTEKLALCLAAERDDVSAREAAAQLSTGVEALVLAGSTDSSPYADPETGKMHNPIAGLRHDRRYAMSPVSFFSNAYLGAERARQALGTLLLQVQDMGSGDDDVLPVLMSRVRVETSSFGQFQVGPKAWRDPVCAGTDGDPQGHCDAARRLSLHVRWRKDALRRPITRLKATFCERLADPNSTFAVNLRNTGKSLNQARAELGCPPVRQPDMDAPAAQATTPLP
jgi:hypothetical protein